MLFILGVLELLLLLLGTLRTLLRLLLILRALLELILVQQARLPLETLLVPILVTLLRGETGASITPQLLAQMLPLLVFNLTALVLNH